MTLRLDPRFYAQVQLPGFWVGVRHIRDADLEAASEAPSGVGSWLQEAAQRARVLHEAALAGVDVTTLREFERWLGPTAAVVCRREEEMDDAV